MQASADALAFAPPPEPAAVRGFVLAVIAHLLLAVALSLGINWDKETAPAAVEAELWSALPQEAAPPAPPPAPAPEPPQPPVQAPVVQPAPPPPVVKEPDIAIEREKKRKQEEARQREEDEQRRKLEAKKKKQLEEQQRQEKLAEEKKRREEQAKKDKAKQEADARKLDQLRKENLARMMAEASGNGSKDSTGRAAVSSGPSDSYAGRIRARVKPNIVFGDDVPGNPSAEVEVRMAPDGTIVSRKITKSSGVKSWDDAVLRALDKTEILPRDVDGRVHTPLTIEFRLRG